ncbi:Lsr2 family protein (plasmid) [Amycolatopsis sp. FU40]|uniref:histone-like nucleoid-structuring protein Lsr2 n=1 Tax=Amycolatopsis sp. FU40 TaxID=2914159 RepID=UPI001F23079E|nr:Lsr2 family protein [Amycolatopsis sp. FU40]UKD50926.1 Lsr2 family protein [Amycolatopsis sp. FU40]
MAQKMSVEMVDDIDGSVAGQTVPFGLDGVRYEIDLSDANAAALREELARYVAAGKRVGGRKIRGTTAAELAAPRRALTPAERERNQVIRDWARTNGYVVSDRGRIPAEVIREYDERDQKPTQAPARKPRGTARTGSRGRRSSR